MFCCATVLLQACASFAERGSTPAENTQQPVQLKIDSNLGNRNDPAQPLVQGLFRLTAPDRLISYKADYAVKPGAGLLQPSMFQATGNEWEPVTPTIPLAGEDFGQRIDARVPFFAAPLLVGVQDRYQGVLTGPGLAGLATARAADLSWAPDSLRVGLGWVGPTEVPGIFDCGLHASLSLPASLVSGSATQNLDFSGRGCKVFAPDRGLSDLDVDAWTAAWRWQGGAGKNAVHFTVMEPQALSTGTEALRPSYEVGAGRSLTRGKLSAKSSVAVRRVADPLTGRELTRWSAGATLSRQYRSVAVSASLQHGTDALWFLPAYAGGDQFDIGLNFRRWIQNYLSLRNLDAGLTWSLTRPVLAGQPLDTRLFWTFSLSR